MTPVTIAGMVMGVLLILTAIAVFWSKKAFPVGGVAVTLVGLVLIGMSQWTTIKINAGGASIDLRTLRAQVQETAAAAEEVASQAQQAAAAAETTREQVAVLARQLETRNVLPSAAARSIRATLDTAPRADLERLRSAQEDLGRVTRP
jgi:hypothetical protein